MNTRFIPKTFFAFKRSFITQIFFCLIFMTMLSCKKNYIIADQHANAPEKSCDGFRRDIAFEQGIIRVSNYSDFDELLKQAIEDTLLFMRLENTGFSSYFKTHPEDHSLNDLLLSKVLSENGMIIIGDTLFKISSEDSVITVYYYAINDTTALHLISQNSMNMRKLCTYLIPQDTIELTESETIYNNNTFNRASCAPSQAKNKPINKYYVNGELYRFKAKVYYVDLLFYKELSVKLKSDKKVTTGWQDLPVPYLSIFCYFKIEPKNKPVSYGNMFNQNTNQSDIKLTIYSSSRCLSNYYVDPTVSYVKYGDVYNLTTYPTSQQLNAYFFGFTSGF